MAANRTTVATTAWHLGDSIVCVELAGVRSEPMATLTDANKPDVTPVQLHGWEAINQALCAIPIGRLIVPALVAAWEHRG